MNIWVILYALVLAVCGLELSEFEVLDSSFKPSFKCHTLLLDSTQKYFNTNAESPTQATFPIAFGLALIMSGVTAIWTATSVSEETRGIFAFGGASKCCMAMVILICN